MIRRFFTRILMMILIAAYVFNWLQVQRLQSEVTALQTRELRQKQGSTDKSDAPEARLGLSDLQSQWKHLWNRADAFRSAK